jgi:hypothetical protein
MTADADPTPLLSLWRTVRGFIDSLAGRLLALTVVTVLAGEIFIFAPAIASFHENWLRERMNLAQIAALVLEGSPDQEVGRELEDELLINAGVLRAALSRAGERVLLLESAETPSPDSIVTYDYTTAQPGQPIWWAF